MPSGFRPCATPRCPILVSKGHCVQHAKAIDRQRGTAQARGYDSAWATYSQQFRAKHPVCGERADGSMDATNSRCVQRGLTSPAECVDHTIPMAQGGSKWDERNHMSACLNCNSWKANTIEREAAGVAVNP
jgi:5-methylcytosine-specific restriction endonuclease McrA